MPELRRAVYRQGRRDDGREDVVWNGGGSQPALESLRVSSRAAPRPSGPAASWLRGQTSPELLYLETKWASLIPFAKVADLLREVLPVDAGTTTRRSVVTSRQRPSEWRKSWETSASSSCSRTSQVEQEDLAPPDGPITVGIDGGYVRAAHKEGFFEVIAGRSVVAFRRAADDEVPEAKCFGYVQTYDREAAAAAVGADEVAGVAGQSAGGVHVRRRRGCAAGANVSASATANTGSTGSTSPCG